MEPQIPEGNQKVHLRLFYEQLSAVAVMGCSCLPLERWEDECKRLPIEFSESRANQIGQKFIMGTRISPLVSIAASQGDWESSIMSFGLSVKDAEFTLEMICKKIGFNKTPIVQTFASRLYDEIRSQIVPMYHESQSIARMLKIPFEKAYASCAYADYLINGIGMEKTRATTEAFKRFGVDFRLDYGHIEVVN